MPKRKHYTKEQVAAMAKVAGNALKELEATGLFPNGAPRPFKNTIDAYLWVARRDDTNTKIDRQVKKNWHNVNSICSWLKQS